MMERSDARTAAAVIVRPTAVAAGAKKESRVRTDMRDGSSGSNRFAVASKRMSLLRPLERRTDRKREREKRRQKKGSFLDPSLLPLAVNVHCNVVSLLVFYKCDLAYSAATRKVRAESRRGVGRSGWIDAGRGGRADRDQMIRARKVAAGKEGR